MVIGSFTTKRIRDDFTTQTAAKFDFVQQQVTKRQIVLTSPGRDSLGRSIIRLEGNLDALRGDSATVVRLFLTETGQAPRLLRSTDPKVDLGSLSTQETEAGDYRVENRRFGFPVQPTSRRAAIELGVRGPFAVAVAVQVGRSYDGVERTSRRVVALLTFGVAVGTALALLAGLAVGTRAMRPVKRMTSTARHIARTRDLEARMPRPPVDDEIAELAGTLQDMLDELAAAQNRIDAALQQQREFVADASHELRTPLTSVQANLELLALSTTGDDREAADSALRSSRRMRLLVTDLLLLARMDARRETVREPVDLDRAILEAVDELEPQFGDHELVLDLESVTVDGTRDELVRVVANLVGNALRHTPGGTEVRVSLRLEGARARLVVEDDGPGIPADLREKIFDRFVRRGGEGAGSTGIGLAIVRAAAQRHGGDVTVEPVHDDGTGARFVVTLGGRPAEPGADDVAGGAVVEDEPVPEGHGGDGRLLDSPRRAARRIQRRLRGSRGGAGDDRAAQGLAAADPDGDDADGAGDAPGPRDDEAPPPGPEDGAAGPSGPGAS